MDLPLADLLDFARGVAREADAITLEHFGGAVRAHRKGDGTFVTAADTAVERLVRDRVTDAYPTYGLLGEEEGGALDPGRPTWVVDPIDSTANFLRGLPMYATLLGLVVDGRAVVGVASVPAMGECWWAAQGHGAFCNGQPVRVSAVTSLEDTHLLHGGLDWFRGDAELWELLGRLADACWRTRGFGDFWMHLLVAGGMADVALERDLKPWDIAAPECIVAEAGGRLTSWEGGPALADPEGAVLTTNGHLHDAVLALLPPR